ncbi:chaperone modulator CbpM [Microbulbifer yueqingensis]|uniref:Transcriptional regulator, MerR family n=1 Tax=Microbulbifer yueqingensis TaxID=658219 RepID=A0A1G9ELC8_9GAMM|nr:chaperone modulator CbpM [Microbulbifer yueqingensis]SDK76841.1 transcriptional regulator, MerR family [Microbulbifer yueqingensis]
MQSDKRREVVAAILDEHSELTLGELCRACGIPAEEVLALVEEGVIEPRGRGRARWRFSGICVRRVRRVYSLERDLGVNLAGAALAIELLEEIERLQARLARLERGEE